MRTRTAKVEAQLSVVRVPSGICCGTASAALAVHTHSVQTCASSSGQLAGGYRSSRVVSPDFECNTSFPGYLSTTFSLRRAPVHPSAMYSPVLTPTSILLSVPARTAPAHGASTLVQACNLAPENTRTESTAGGQSQQAPAYLPTSNAQTSLLPSQTSSAHPDRVPLPAGWRWRTAPHPHDQQHTPPIPIGMSLKN
ncbi:hypothetical protein B0H16DRAFT_235332 [Mycena metata]|uniref:Uncharacterized protein n=1 Tax=Mycena metata TaxID=1033252 RepID=A0AAD7JQQ1_9AGAR|nr:hypothetical protein B0H16DRAFT_235332 [Mycena metata]